MAEKRKKTTLLGNTASVDKAVDVVGRMQMSEIGFTGLKITNGLIYEDIKKELVFPQSNITYKQMSYDSTIASALSYYEAMMLKAKWKMKAPKDATDQEKELADTVWNMLHDMDHSFYDFIQEVSSMNTYGFSVHEIVLRKRLKSKGSKYNDGMVGIQSLPIRSQDTIDKWIYDETERELLGVRQNLGLSLHRSIQGKSQIVIPRKKFLLFRTGKRRGNPFGESLLKNCYFAWRYKVLIEEQEALGVQRDLAGVPHAMVPAQIMAPDASPEQKAQYEVWKNIVRNIHLNQQSGLVTPLVYDPETKQPLYKFELMKNDGGKAYDTTKIKEYYQKAILTALHADILIMGQSNTGSYALGNIKGTMTAISIEARLMEIANVINHHLIPLLAEYNGWDKTRLPELHFEDIESTDVEQLSKAYQRAASTGLLEIDRAVLNKVRESIGVDPKPDDAPVDWENLTGNTSRSGDGFASAGDGTSTDGNNIDSNDDNKENVG